MPTPMPISALEVENLTVDIEGHRILDNVSFTVPIGSTAAVIGPNGAGKSILIKTIMRLLPKTSGRVKIFDVPHEQYKKIAKSLSYVPQRLELDRNFPLTIRGLFSLKSRRSLGMGEADLSRARALLKTVGMEGTEHQRLSTLSGGQLQRVLIAYSLMDKPKLLILDEPAAGIDVSGQESIYMLLQRIQKEEQLTMILISHELDVVMEYADQVLCLNRKLLCAGLPHEALTTEVIHEMYGTPAKHFHHGHGARHV